jgi:crotonobetainyl-CoA:carnitine CoA-transferase CaiB-like acyl-CoA transferase
VKARGTILKDDTGRRHIAPVIRFGDEPAAPILREPALGEHTEEVLGPLRRHVPYILSPPGADRSDFKP